MESLPKLIDYIHFQLDGLSGKNKHHDFEHLCRHLARLVVSPNILPATGPVGAGGDQGKDFESFEVQGSVEPEVPSPWRVRDNRSRVFACSLDQRAVAKIRDDVAAICSGTPKPDVIYCFSNQEIQVSARHGLQKWAHDTHVVLLEVLDVNAIAEQLARHELFWIAQEFLDIPSEFYPRPVSGGTKRYADLRKKWISDKQTLQTFADFVEVKYGIRFATFEKEARVDVGDWIRVLEDLVRNGGPDDLCRRAQYEICVAALRGQNNLTSKKALVEDYFSKIAELSDVSDARDAVVLLSYCSTATLLKEFESDVNLLHEWSRKIVQQIEKLLKTASGANTKCGLLHARAYASTLQFKSGTTPVVDFDEAFKWWNRLVKEAEGAPLFPLEDFADQLVAITPVLGGDTRFGKLTARVDKLLEKRSKGFLAADKCRDRAVAYMEADRPIFAVRELHNAKIKWFAEETIRGAILSMLLLADLYRDLKLFYASKYYSLAAAFLIHRHSDDQIKGLLPTSTIQLANTCYAAGEWITFSDLVPLVVVLQYQYRPDPGNWERHEDFRAMIAHAMIAKIVVDRLGTIPTQEYLKWTTTRQELPDGVGELINDPPSDVKKSYQEVDTATIWERINDDLDGTPFADAGETRTYHWRALGIEWICVCKNALNTVAVVEEFVASLQILLAELADHDLLLVPTKVEVEVQVLPVASFQIKDLPSNTSAKWLITLSDDSPSDSDSRRSHVEAVSIATAILIRCTLLPESDTFKIIENAFKEGLPGKTFSVRPYRQLLKEFASNEDVRVAKRAQCSKLVPPSLRLPREPAALAPVTGPSPLYSREKSLQFISNRYKNAIRPIRLTLARLRTSERFKGFVKTLRAKRYLDWHILVVVVNGVLNCRINKIAGLSAMSPHEQARTMQELMSRDERVDDPLVSEEEFFKFVEWSGPIQLAAIAKTWGLRVKSQTPDFGAIERLLAERFEFFKDDVPHEPLFD